jgi:hypothetical protein
MADIYVGTTSAGSANGTSWANRYGTLNAAEDKPVVAGDRVIVGPGVYRELLTVDVSGSSGSPIEYYADVSGRLTDGIGGVVRITGSDNDQTATRANCISNSTRNYRTFTGFTCDMCTSHLVNFFSASNCIVQDCCFEGVAASGINSVTLSGTGTNFACRRCIFSGGRSSGVHFTHSSTLNDTAHLVENCLFVAQRTAGILITRVGGITVKNCVFVNPVMSIQINTALAVGQTITVNNCLILWCSVGLTAQATGEIVENYNSFWGNITDRTNTATGANSNAYPPLFNPQLLLDDFMLPNLPMFGLSEWSPLRAIAGTGMSTDDLYGITRPATDSKKSWGAIQHAPRSREVTTVRTGSASLKLSDAGIHQIYVQTSAVSTIFSVYVQWEADYAGTKPRMVIKQPGQSDTTVTATGSSGSWELLTTTLTPAASPGYVIVELQSLNTAAAANFDVFFDDFVSQPA